jgi:hypothetical protein
LTDRHKNIIEINGRRYDAKTGKPIGQISEPIKHISSNPKTPSIDGFYTSSSPSSLAGKPKIKLSSIKTTKVKKRQPTAAPARKPQKANTLMRKSVEKPNIKPSMRVDHNIHKKSSLIHARNSSKNSITKSPLIKKFAPEYKITRTSAPLSVKQEGTDFTKKPIQQVVNTPKPRQTLHVNTNNKISEAEKLFNNALSRAPTEFAHRKKNKKSKRVLTWASSVSAVIILVGFIAYMNYPAINLTLASSRAGFSANMPKYKPGGFSFSGPVSYEPGKLTINFNSNTDDRNYSVTQEVSNWNSQTLQDNFLTSNNKSFRTTLEAGKTIYIFDNSNATWVNGGIWYTVNSNSLSSEQLLNIASSL